MSDVLHARCRIINTRKPRRRSYCRSLDHLRPHVAAIYGEEKKCVNNAIIYDELMSLFPLPTTWSLGCCAMHAWHSYVSRQVIYINNRASHAS